jgi:hypothetical protein
MKNKSKVKNNLTDIRTKKCFLVESIGAEDFANRKIIGLKLVVRIEGKLRRTPLFKAPIDLRNMAIVRQTPYRLQLTLNQYHLARMYSNRYGIKNPIDEFVTIKQVARTYRGKDLLFFVDVIFVDNMTAVKMMSDLHKELERQRQMKKQDAKNKTTKPKRKIRKRRR